MRQVLASNKWVQYYLPTALLIFLFGTIERIVVTDDGGYDRLYGFPFIFRSNAFACSFCYEIYTDALLLNIMLDLVLAVSLFKLVERAGFKLKHRKVLNLVSLSITLIFIATFYLLTLYSLFKWHNYTPFRFVSSEFKFWMI
jgi:hypothetical protein